MIAPALVLSLALSATDGYVRSRANTGILNDPKAHCLWWKEGTQVVYQQNQDGNPGTPNEDEFTAIRSSFQSWNTVFQSCGNLTIAEGARTANRKVSADDSENVVLFRQKLCTLIVGQSDACWDEGTCANQYDCWEFSADTIGLTSTFHNPVSGRIAGADIELNAFGFVFTTVDSPKCIEPVFKSSCVATDIQNTMTHEVGHMIGLDHSTRVGSTMLKDAPAGETSKRNLDADSQTFVCVNYPKGGATKDCRIDPVDSTLGEPTSCSLTGGPFEALGVALTVLSIRRRKLRR